MHVRGTHCCQIMLGKPKAKGRNRRMVAKDNADEDANGIALFLFQDLKNAPARRNDEHRCRQWLYADNFLCGSPLAMSFSEATLNVLLRFSLNRSHWRARARFRWKWCPNSSILCITRHTRTFFFFPLPLFFKWRKSQQGTRAIHAWPKIKADCVHGH